MFRNRTLSNLILLVVLFISQVAAAPNNSINEVERNFSSLNSSISINNAPHPVSKFSQQALMAPGDTIRVSLNSSGAEGNSESNYSSISADGRYVAFASSASNLVTGDTNNTRDVFVHDTQTNITTRVSVASTGIQGNSMSSFDEAPSISADGRYVAFSSDASNLVIGDTNSTRDIFVHDTQTNTTSRVSIDSTGIQQGNSYSRVPSISADGRYIAFRSLASNLVSGDTNENWDVFVRDTQTNTTARVSLDSNGAQIYTTGVFFFTPSISADGRYVAFVADANNVVSGDMNSDTDVFVRDTQMNTTIGISLAPDGTQGNDVSCSPSISADGRYVAFISHAGNLVSGDTNWASDVFVRDTHTNTTTRISVASDGTQGNNSPPIYSIESRSPSISADGRYVAFVSDATNLVIGDMNEARDVFVRDMQVNTTKRVSLNSNGMEGYGDYYGFGPSISADGLYVAFESAASNLVSGDTNGMTDVFVHGIDFTILPPDVSSDLSVVTINPAFVPADGVTSATVTITLMDTNNNPVMGKNVILFSYRGGNDIIVQPIAPTDVNGQTTGAISSIFPGTSQIYVVDVTDNVKLSQQPFIQFTDNHLALRQRINTLNTLSTDSLTRIAMYAQSAGEHGDYFRDAIAEDVSNMALNAVGLFTGTVEGVKDINRLKGGVQLAMPGLEDAGYGVVNGFLSKYPDSRDLFNFTIRKALQTGDYSSLTQPVLNAGFRYYAVKYINKKLESKVEDLTQDAVIRAWKDISSSSGGFTEAGNWLKGDINNMKSELNDLSNLPIPSMSAGQQAAYVEDLHKRSMVPVIIANTTRQQVFLLENVRAAHESNAWSGNFTLKFLADALATTAFDGPGHIMVNGLTDGFDLYLNARKFDSDMLAFSQVPGILKGSAESATYIFNNEATGLDRVHRLLPPRIVTGQITAVRNYSQGQSWGPFYFEDRSFSEIDIKNASASETGTFEVITQYGYNTRIFRVPWAYMPLVKSETILLAPGESKTVRIYYKNGGTGGSPDKNDLISFDVLAANSTGVFYVGTKRVSWNPQIISGGVGSWAIENSSSLAQSDVVASSDAAIIENPISVYVTVNSIDQTYQAEIYVMNPFDQTIDANITQDLPAGITVLTTDGIVTPDGLAISWQKNVASNEIALVTFTFNYLAAPNIALSLPAAVMSFVEPASGQSVNIQSNSPAFTGLSPLSIEGYAPIGLPNVESNISISVTNLAGASNNGTIEITLADINGQIFADAKPFNIDGFGQQIVAFTLPGLSEGLYPVEIFTTINGVTTRVFGDTYQVRPPPTIASIMRANAASTGASSVDFKVAFSESVVGVDAGDFILTTSGVSGAAISGVSGSGGTYTITVNTGMNNGTIRLDVPDSAIITDLAGNPLENLPFTTGQTYTISKPVPKAPALRSPRTNMVTNDNTPTFWWMKAKDGQSYEFEVAADANFISNVENEFVNGTSQTIASPFVDGNYFWHVRAYNASNQPGVWSSARTFTIDTTGPSIPMLSTPTNNTSSKRTPTFKWLSVPTAVLYEFQYDNDLNFTDPISYAVTVRGTFRRPPAMGTGTYYWRVRAKDAAGNWGEWSLPFTINITSP